VVPPLGIGHLRSNICSTYGLKTIVLLDPDARIVLPVVRAIYSLFSIPRRNLKVSWVHEQKRHTRVCSFFVLVQNYYTKLEPILNRMINLQRAERVVTLYFHVRIRVRGDASATRANAHGNPKSSLPFHFCGEGSGESRHLY
jgi:hypothetical protein